MAIRRFVPKLTLGHLMWIAGLAFPGYRPWPQAAAALGVGSAGIASPDFRLATLDGDTVSLDAGVFAEAARARAVDRLLAEDADGAAREVKP